MISATGSTASTGVPGLITTPAAAAVLADHLQRVVDVRRRLGVDGDHVGARLRERLDLALGPLDHQVAVEDAAALVDELARSTRRSASPIVIGGTNFPSIASKWITFAPASITSSTCSAEAREVAGEQRGRDLRPSGSALSLAALEGRAAPRGRTRTRGTARPPAAAARSPSGARTTPVAAARRARGSPRACPPSAPARPRRATAARRRARAAPPP